MKRFHEGSSLVKIDEYLRKFNYTLVSALDELRISLYRETENGWKCEHDFTSKQQLLTFVGGLK